MISTIKTTAIAAGISFAVGAVSAWWVTADYKNAKHQAILAKIQLDAEKALSDAKDRVLKIERENNRLAQEIEVRNAKFKQELDEIGRDNERLVAERGLYDRGATQSDCPVSGNTGTPSKPARPSTGTRLSAELEQFLLRETRRADEAAAYAKTCYEWVQQLEKQR